MQWQADCQVTGLGLVFGGYESACITFVVTVFIPIFAGDELTV